MNRIIILAVMLIASFGFIEKGQAQNVVDASTLNNKIMAGYQGWFGAPGDGNEYGWIHWSSGTPEADNITIDLWPDLREYDQDELYPTNFYYSDGSNAGLFSSY